MDSESNAAYMRGIPLWVAPSQIHNQPQHRGILHLIATLSGNDPQTGIACTAAEAETLTCLLPTRLSMAIATVDFHVLFQSGTKTVNQAGDISHRMADSGHGARVLRLFGAGRDLEKKTPVRQSPYPRGLSRGYLRH